jgi:hypothetical protein
MMGKDNCNDDFKRDAVARRLRTVAGNDNRGRLENSGLFIFYAL